MNTLDQFWTIDLSNLEGDIHAWWEADAANHVFDESCGCGVEPQPYPPDPSRRLFVHVTDGVPEFEVPQPPPPMEGT